jgi:hypothetical protein
MEGQGVVTPTLQSFALKRRTDVRSVDWSVGLFNIMQIIVQVGRAILMWWELVSDSNTPHPTTHHYYHHYERACNVQAGR